MSRLSSLLILVCIGALLVETFAAPDEPIIVRSKRQQCRCVKNPNGGLTCSCAKGPANGSSSSVGSGVQFDQAQSNEIANQLTAMTQQSSGVGAARCGCIQIVIQGAPQYNCQCGDQNGNPLPTSTTMAPTTTSTTTTTTTTTPAPTTTSTTTTTQAPVSYPQVPTQTQGNNGACNCIMISITSPQTAQYQCQCAQPQQQQMQYADTYDYTQPAYTQPSTTAPTTTTTQAPTTQAPTTTSPVQYADTTATQYPLTTTCVMYVNVPTTACSCLPQYDQCAQNVCCLKAKYRSYKKAEETQPSTIDVLMNVLQTIKTKLE